MFQVNFVWVPAALLPLGFALSWGLLAVGTRTPQVGSDHGEDSSST